jgi:hypothetical protein
LEYSLILLQKKREEKIKNHIFNPFLRSLKLAHPFKINWLRLENRLRDALENWYQDDPENPENRSSLATIYLIDEIIANETRRGNAIPDEGQG